MIVNRLGRRTKGVALVALIGGLGAVVSTVSAGPAAADPPDGFPDQPTCVEWPTNGWESGALPAGVALDDLDGVVAGAVADDRPSQSLVVIHGGRSVYEWYDSDVGPTTIQPSFSVSKSFTSTMIGLLVDEGTLDLDTPAPVPEWADPTDPRHAITLRNLLHMSSGLEWNEGPGDYAGLFQAPDAGAFVASRPLVAPPGTQYRYSTGTTTLISRIIAQKTTSYGDDYQALLDDMLFEPLGITPASVLFDPIGVWFGGSHTNTTTRNFAKLGLLYLRGGVWEDERFLSEDWIDFVRTPSATNPGYGGHFRLHDDGRFSMRGLFSQSVYIAPDLDLVVAVNNGAASPEAVAALFEGASVPPCPPQPNGFADVGAVATERARRCSITACAGN